MALIFPAPAQIKNLLDPTAGTDAATKQYVDNSISGGSGNITVGNVIATANIIANVITSNGNIVAANANLGNTVIANYFTGNGSLLSSISGANVTGVVANANYAAYAGNITIAAQSNITSLGTLTGLTSTGTVDLTNASNVSLGSVSNIKISGGTAGYVLSTDGQGNLSWLSAATGTGNANISGSNTQLFFNDNSSNTLGSSANLTFNSSTKTLTVDKIASNGAGLTNITGANVTGQVANALVAGTVYASAQPNITSVGTLSSLTIAGTGSVSGGNLLSANYVYGTLTTNDQPNITSVGSLGSLTVIANILSGNANLGNLTTSNYFKGSGNLLSNIQAGNITGQVSNALVAGTVYTAAQPNITSVGTLTSLSVTGNVDGNNFVIRGNLTVQGTTVTVNSETVNYDEIVTGNLTAGNANLGNLATSNYFSGNGSLLTSITGANVTGQVGNALVAGTVYTAAQPNITSVGTLGSLAVTANITAGNVLGGNLVSATYLGGTLTTAAQPNITSVGTLASLLVGNATANVNIGNGTITLSAVGNANLGNSVTANYLLGNGYYLTGIGSSYSNNDVANYLPTFTGNIRAGNANLGNLVTANYFTGTLTTAAQPNITSVGTLSSLTVTGNTSTGNLSVTSNVNIGAVAPYGAIALGSTNGIFTTFTTAEQAGTWSVSMWWRYPSTNTNAPYTLWHADQYLGVTVTGNLVQFSGPGLTGGGFNATVPTNIAPDTWFFYSFSYDSTTQTFYIGQNGSVSSYTGKGTISTGGVPGFVVGKYGTDLGTANSDGPAYFEDVSLVIGTALYKTSYSLPTIHTAKVTGQRLLLLAKTSGTLLYDEVSTTDVNYSGTAPTFYSNGPLAGSNNIVAYANGYLTTINANLGNLTTSNYFAGVLTTSAQPNITSVGTLLNTTMGSANSLSGGNLVSANYITGVLTTSAQPNITSVGTLLNTTMGSANSLSGGNLVSATYLGGTLTTAAQPNITSVGTLLNTTMGAGNSLSGGNLVSANYITGVLTTAAQPNITSVGSLSSLVVTGNITSGNANLGNLATSNYFSGNASLLASITGANVTGFVPNANVANTAYSVSGSNVTGQVANALVAGTVYSSSQPNITSVGTLSVLTVVGDTTLTGNLIVTGNTITVASNNTSYVDSIIELHTQANLAPLTSDDGKDIGVRAHYYKGADKHAFFGIANDTLNFEYYYDGNEVNGDFVGTYGNIKGQTFISNATIGTAPFTINSTTQVANLNAQFANVVTNDAQPNITTVGTLTTLQVSGNLTTGTGSGGNISGVNYISANYFVGNGSQLTGLTAIAVGSANYANYAGNVTVASQPNITSLGTLTGLTIGNSTANVVVGNGTIVLTTAGSITGGNLVSATYLTGTLTTPAQPNITSVGTLSSLLVGNSTANANIGNGTITLSASGNANLGNAVTSNYFVGNGYYLTGIGAPSLIFNGTSSANIGSSGGNLAVSINGTSNVLVVTNTGANLTGYANVTGNITAGNINGGNLIKANYIQADGSLLTNIGGVTYISNGTSNLYTITNGNVVANIGGNNSLIITSTGANITGYANVTGNITAGNINGGNLVKATYLQGDGSLITNIGGASYIVNGTSNMYAASSGNITANVGGNNSLIITSTGANVTGYANVSGNITAGNITVATGNITATSGYLVGNGYYITGIGAPNAIYNGTSNLYVLNNGNAVANIGGNNSLVITSTGANIAGYATVTGNITAGNINGGNLVKANYLQGDGSLITNIGAPSAIFNGTSNLYVVNNGNVVGNVGGNNTIVVTSTGVNVAGYMTATGNVTGNFFIGNGSQLTGISTTSSLVDGNSNINVDLNSSIRFSANGVSNVVSFTGTNANINTNLIVAGKTSLGAVGNVKITGGAANYILITDGTGNLSWTPATTMTVNQYTGTGAKTTFGPLSSTPTNVNQTIVNYNGVLQLKTAYSLSGANIVFSEAPASGSLIEVTVITTAAVTQQSGTTTVISDYISNGNTSVATLGNSTIVLSANGVSNIATFLDTGSYINTALTMTGVTTLGPISNVKISGGSSGYVISTDGSGNLSWVAQSGGGGGGGTGYNLSNGNSSVFVNSNAAITVSANGVANIVSLLDTQSYVNTALSVSGNISLTGANVSLGPVANIKITGGSSGYVLSTDGVGNISWVAQTGGTGYNIVNGNSNVYVNSNAQVTISANGVSNVVSILDTGSYINSNVTMTKVTSLGAVGNVKITGGSTNYILSTDGTGNISWVQPGTVISNIGPIAVANVKITGGTSGQYLQTDGTGNLTWASAAGGGGSSTIYSDVFTGTGLQTQFTLSTTPTSVNQTTINYNGVLQLRSSYTLSGANVVFSEAPSYGAVIEVTTVTAASLSVSPTITAKAMVMGIIFGG